MRKCLLYLFFFLLGSSLQAQVIIEDEREEKDAELSEYWDKHMSLEFGFSVAKGLGVESNREYSYTNLKWKDSFFDWLDLNFETNAYNRRTLYVLNLDNSALEEDRFRRKNLEDRIKYDPLSPEEELEIEQEIRNIDNKLNDLEERDEVSLQINDSEIIFREANAKISLGESADILVGYHTVIWGQMEGFSPVDFLLPIRTASGSQAISKVESRLTQKTAVLSIFPHEKVEIKAYYFPDISLDPAIHRFRENQVEDLDDEFTSDNPRQDEIEYAFALPERSEQPQYAGRILFYFDWATIGFTYYEGWDQFSFYKDIRISTFMQETEVPYEEQFGHDSNGNPIDGTVYRTEERKFYRTETRPELPRIKSYGFETAIPLKNWSLRLEATISRALANVDLFFAIESYNRFEANNERQFYKSEDFPEGEDSPAQKVRKTFFEYAIKQNNSSFSYEKENTVYGMQLVRNGEKWDWAFALINLDFDGKPVDEKGETLIRYAEEAKRAENVTTSDDDSGLNTIPMLLGTRYLSEDKKSLVGMGLGFFGFGFGATLFWTKEYVESLRVGLGIEALYLQSSNETTEALDGYELKNALYPAIRFLIGYKL